MTEAPNVVSRASGRGAGLRPIPLSRDFLDTSPLNVKDAIGAAYQCRPMSDDDAGDRHLRDELGDRLLCAGKGPAIMHRRG
jgi:hypothetical protein